MLCFDLLYPLLKKYGEGYIVFIFPSIRLLTFYVKVLLEVFFIHQEMALAGGIRAQLGTCSSLKREQLKE